MEQKEVFGKVVEMITPFVKDQEAIANISMDTSLTDDLKMNSARFVDVVLEMEDAFDIEISDDDADKVRTIGNAVNLILQYTAKP